MRNATEYEAEQAIKILKEAIEAAENANQAGENAVVRAANAILTNPIGQTNESNPPIHSSSVPKVSSRHADRLQDP